MVSKTGRRDPCPCGSKKKYKNCCGQTGAHSTSKTRTKFVFGAVAVGVAGLILMAVLNKSNSTLIPPPGPAPPGKVWSAEHGHWHDAPGPLQDNAIQEPIDPFTAQPTQLDSPSSATKLIPQPPGPAPEGKVWSAEHGHWHDAPGPLQDNQTLQLFDPFRDEPTQSDPSGSASNFVPQPPGPVPPGKVWSSEHGHWHDAPSLTLQPPGPAPEGKVWSPEHGHWHDAPQ